MKVLVAATTLLAIAGGASNATAGGSAITWDGNSATYDNGTLPSVAVTALHPTNQMEVHQGAYPALWAHPASTYAQLGGSSQYASGWAPTVANDSNATFLEIHQGDNGNAPQLWYGIGTGTASFNANPVGTVGFHPVIAAIWNFCSSWDSSCFRDGRLGTAVAAEVHMTANSGAVPLMIDIGKPTFSFDNLGNPSWKSANWTQAQYVTGAYPTVSLFPISQTKFFVMEAHQAQDGLGPLWSDFGILTLTDTSWTINWISAAEIFDEGQHPSIAICRANETNQLVVVEVNEGPSNTLLSYTGFITVSPPSFSWTPGSGLNYTSGFRPRISCNQYGFYHTGGDYSPGLEVHQGTSGSGPLWYATFTAH